MSETKTNTLIIGSSAAGLASAACLQKQNIPYIILEQRDQVGHAWRNHYHRLHLHTNKGSSGLPYYKMPKYYDQYPSRQQVVAYLENYAEHFNIQPQFKQEVTSLEQENGQWKTLSKRGDIFLSKNVIVATGQTRIPNIPRWEGQEAFEGKILHSSQYKNGIPFAGKDVLVVGFGNSACEIAICLAEHSAHPTMAVRSPVNVVPHVVFGIPILAFGQVMGKLPPKLADALNMPLLNYLIGNIEETGLKRKKYGAMTQIAKDRSIPLLDLGTMELLRNGKIKAISEGIEKFTKTGVVFTNGHQQDFDAVILGTGYKPKLGDFIKDVGEVTDHEGMPLVNGQETTLKGLYFCGFYISPAGMLREIGLEAKRIAKAIGSLG